MKFQGLFQETTESERTMHTLRVAASHSIPTISDSVMHDMGVLDSKSSALLTFISVVLASLTFSLGLFDGGEPFTHVIRTGIFFFMAVFGFAAWIDLRCLRTIGPAHFINMETTSELENVMLSEISQRRAKYLLSLKITEISFILLALFVLSWLLLSARAAHFYLG